MSALELWPIFETTYQIGLGAGLAAACIWLANRSRSAVGPKSGPGNRRLVLLEDISNQVGRVNHSFAKYSALVIESIRFGSRWPVARRQELERVNAELIAEFEKLAHAESKLLMLGEKTMEKTLRLYGAKIALFRKQVYVGRQDISDQEIAELKSAIMQVREQFYDILSRRYDKLLAA